MKLLEYISMEDWTTCHECKEQHPYIMYYLRDGPVSNVCQYCNYGTDVVNPFDNTITRTLDLPKQFTTVTMAKERQRLGKNFDSAYGKRQNQSRNQVNYRSKKEGYCKPNDR